MHKRGREGARRKRDAWHPFGRMDGCCPVALPPAFAADEPSEQVGVAKLPAATPYRVYLNDFAINHVVDGRSCT